MSLATLTFQVYTDSALTILFSGVESLLHQTDFSDNPQVFTLYFGSNTAGRLLKATSNPGVDNITVTPTDITPNWVASTAYTTANAVEPVTPNGYWYQCTTAGTASASEPTWPTTGIGSTVTDGSVVWTLIGAKHLTTEIKLASTEGGLASATAGAALSLGVQIDSLVANAKPIWVQVTNAVSTVSNTTTVPHLSLYINSVNESN